MTEQPPDLVEGWYLMSTADLERELERRRSGRRDLPPSEALHLSVDDALAYRNAGNLPDDKGRSLRLVLEVDGPGDLRALHSKCLTYEPDFHDAPSWKREGSRPVNIVPLALPGSEEGPAAGAAWWEDAELAALEDEWRARGEIHGLKVPGPYRGFVYKTVLALVAAGREITPDSVADSIARWVPEAEAREIRAALNEANS